MGTREHENVGPDQQLSRLLLLLAAVCGSCILYATCEAGGGGCGTCFHCFQSQPNGAWAVGAAALGCVLDPSFVLLLLLLVVVVLRVTCVGGVAAGRWESPVRPLGVVPGASVCGQASMSAAAGVLPPFKLCL